MRVNLTERFAKSATAEGRKSPIFYDDEVIGFGLQVRDNGRKTFTLDYSFEGRRRRYFVGDYPAWSVAAARDDRMIVLAVASRTTQAISGATSYSVGVAGNTSQFGGWLGVALGSSNIGVIGPTAFYANTPVRVTRGRGKLHRRQGPRHPLYALAFAAPTS